MYTGLLFGLLALAGFLIYRGVRAGSRYKIGGGVLMALATAAFFWFMGFAAEMLWFDALGYGRRFWSAFAVQVIGAAVTGLLGGALLWALTLGLPPAARRARYVGVGLGLVSGAMWGYENWDTIFVYINGVKTAVRDPILGKDAGFYLFSLPFYDALHGLLMQLAVLGAAVSVYVLFLRFSSESLRFQTRQIPEDASDEKYHAFYRNAAFLALVLAADKFLERYHLLLSYEGTVRGAGWTDVHVTLPALWFVIGLTLLAAAALLVPAARAALMKAGKKIPMDPQFRPFLPAALTAAVLMLAWAGALRLLPDAFQRFRVEPNEITFEKEYIGHNIDFTRRGFNLNHVTEREFPAAETLTPDIMAENRNLFANVRLWDWRALDAVYKQFQEIRLYYEFEDVDIDRYVIDGAYRQVMVSAREMELENLPAQSRTFVNKRFKYTHGYGVTLTSVSEFTPQGLPNLLVKDIPPKSAFPSLEVKRPEIYYGELTKTHVIVNSREKEFDYPSGDENTYTRYAGKGGVRLSNIWRKFIYGYKFDGIRLFLSDYPTSESRIMFRRNIRERVKTLAPFLHFDSDPYIVLANGRLYWIIDAYTVSAHYPYSEPLRSAGMAPDAQSVPGGGRFSRDFHGLAGVNYIRNSVKAVVDAYEGSATFYVYEPDDPVIRVWRKAFPELFKDKDRMPEALRAHVRYPADMLLAQGLVYAKYHMTDPAVFYNQEDLWVRATEKYYNDVQPVVPYYIIWEAPGSDDPELVLMTPFTPKNRQVLIGWIAGMCDPGNYGKLLAYKFPKEKRILGPQQVETKIDQDRFLSGQLTLWDQRGSNVIRGNVLAIPIEKTIIYVEPIYLKAETAAYPELRLVAVMHNDNLSYAESFDKALEGLFDGTGAAAPSDAAPKGETAGGLSRDDAIQEADAAFEDYLKALGGKKFDAASQALKRLEDALKRLTAPESAANENKP